MSTVEDFSNAPVGATATLRSDFRGVKVQDGDGCWILPTGLYLDAKELAQEGYTLDLPAPATAREALDLAWELAHEVKEGQVIPADTQYLEFYISGLRGNTAQRDFKISPGCAPIRTLEPLPDPEPDWLDAPAILASHPLCADTEPTGLWIPVTGSEGMWEWPHGEFESHWSELVDVIPLYPKGQEA